MTQRSGSQWAVQRRCLAIIRRVQRGGATWEALAMAVSEQEGDEAYNQLEDEPLREAIGRDVKRIRDALNINIRYSRTDDVYEYQPEADSLPLLDLPDEDLATMVWLEQVFPPNTPKHKEVVDFLRRLRLFLGEERRLQMAERQLELVGLTLRDQHPINPKVLADLQRAIDRHQRIEIVYQAAGNDEGFFERHILQIYEPIYFENGHYYIEAWSLYMVYKGQETRLEDYRTFRVERIQATEVLPLKFPLQPKRQKRYAVSYRLEAKLAKLGVPTHRWIDIEETTYLPDGAAVVHGSTTNLFFCRQTLLRYGGLCTVIGGSELLEGMQRTVKSMAENYGMIVQQPEL